MSWGLVQPSHCASSRTVLSKVIFNRVGWKVLTVVCCPVKVLAPSMQVVGDGRYSFADGKLEGQFGRRGCSVPLFDVAANNPSDKGAVPRARTDRGALSRANKPQLSGALQSSERALRECASRGELPHIGTKRLGRIDGVGHRITGDRRGQRKGIGWDAVHLAIDDHSALNHQPLMSRILGAINLLFRNLRN